MKLNRIFYLILLTTISLFANVKLITPDTIVKGEPLIFSIEAYGNEIEFPKLSSIDGNSVQVISSSTSRSIINSVITKRIKKIYSLYLSKDITIPSLEFKIDGNKFYTDEKNISISNPVKTKSDIFDLTIKTNKNELFVGEDFLITLVFKYKKNAQIVDLGFEKPNFDNFWYKQLDEAKKYENGDWVIQEIKFLLFPLKEGTLSIEPLNIQAQIIDASRESFTLFSNATSSVKIYSNKLDLYVKALPSNVDLIGNFEINASIDKSKIKLGESISYKLEVKGQGNIEDIKDIKLNIPNATIYENKPETKSEYKDGKYQGIYTKVFSIIPNDSLEIPAVSLEYYDKNLEQVILKETKTFSIEVENKVPVASNEKLQKSSLPIETKQVIKIVEKNSIKYNIIYFCLGIMTTLLILGLYLYVINFKRKKEFNDSPLIKKVKKSKTKKELLKLLSVYVKIDRSLDALIFKLEKSDNIIDIKKEIIKLLKQIDIKR